MGYIAPPMFDVSNIVMWKHRRSMYLKTLVLHAFLAATKKSYLGNSKHIEVIEGKPRTKSVCFEVKI